MKKNKGKICFLIIILFSIIIMSGCTKKQGIKTYQINELADKANINDEVIVEGRWFEWGDIQKIISDKGHLHILISENVNMSTIEEDTTYLFSGYLRYGELPCYTQNMLYLEITSFEEKI